MISHLVNFLLWLQTWDFKDWTILVLSIVVFVLIVAVGIFISAAGEATKEISKSLFNR